MSIPSDVIDLRDCVAAAALSGLILESQTRKGTAALSEEELEEITDRAYSYASTILDKRAEMRKSEEEVRVANARDAEREPEEEVEEEAA